MGAGNGGSGVAGAGAEGLGVLADLAPEAVEEADEEGHLVLVVALREPYQGLEQPIEERERLERAVAGGLDQDPAAVVGVAPAVDVAGPLEAVDGRRGGARGEPDGGGDLARAHRPLPEQ